MIAGKEILQGDMYNTVTPVTCNGSVPAVQSERTQLWKASSIMKLLNFKKLHCWKGNRSM